MSSSYLAELLSELRVAEREEVWPEAADGVLSDFGEEEAADCAQSEVAEVSVQLHGYPGGPAAGYRLLPKYS